MVGVAVYTLSADLSFQRKKAQLRHCVIPRLAQSLFQGCLDHDLETGRHKNLSLDKRLCKHCDSQDVEDEIHFLFRCNKYAQIRDEMMRKFPEITIPPLEKDLTNQFIEVRLIPQSLYAP